MKKIAVTGTKGKTTVVNVVAAALLEFKKNVLKVDTTGHSLNGVQKSTLEQSKATWNLVPTVCPGRYLYEFVASDSIDDVAVLETALGSSASAGLGYRVHSVGVFLNVFEDHLGSSERLKTKEDIAKAKQFIFQKIDSNGYAVFNADDELVCGKLTTIPDGYNIQMIPCGLEFKHFDIAKHLNDGGKAFSVEDGHIMLLEKGSKTKLINLKNIPWTFDGLFEPSVWNLLHSVAALYAYFDGDLPDNFSLVVEGVRLDLYGGRLTTLKATNGAMILADYAHEKVSLEKIGQLAHKLLGDKGKVIGVVRIAHDRTDDLIRETGEVIAKNFDELVVYDKIDGVLRQPRNVRSKRFPQVAGRTSEVLAESIKNINLNVTRIVREDEAIAYAAKHARPEDIVVCIVNDDIKQSIQFIKDSFKADFA